MSLSPKPPAWFTAALAMAPERGRIDVQGAGVETLAWGEVGRPGILLIHGVYAHADWWSFTAPWLAEDFRVAAFSLTGMGGSDWRERYAMSTYTAEAWATAEAAGLFDGAAKPVIVCHSFSTPAAAQMAVEAGDRVGGLILVDRPVSQPAATSGAVQGPRTGRRCYDSPEEALARFRLMPEEPCDHPLVIDHVARRALCEVEHQGRRAWSWRHDPELNVKLSGRAVSVAAELAQLRCPVTFLRGGRSSLFPASDLAACRAEAPRGSQFVTIPDAGHNVALHQPLALAAAISAVAGRPRP